MDIKPFDLDFPAGYFVHDSILSQEDSKVLDERPGLWLARRTDVQLEDTPLVLAVVAQDYQPMRRELITWNVAKEAIDNDKFLGPLILECWKTWEFRRLRLVAHLRTEQESPQTVQFDRTEGAKKATEKSWQSPFQVRGHNTVETLKSTMAAFLKHQSIYAPYSAIVNSSGTGKSRLVDELGKTTVVLYMCFRSDSAGGFPPPDKRLRDWLIQDVNSKDEANKRAHALVYALLVVTKQELASISPQPATPSPGTPNNLASKFRELMTSGQTFSEANQYRRDFYKKVIQEADDFCSSSSVVHTSTQTNSPPKIMKTQNGNSQGIQDAADSIGAFLDPSGKAAAPILVLSFDESHCLTTTSSARGWSIFSCLRRALRETREKRIFSLFLSTAGKFQEFSPEASMDLSDRVANRTLNLLPSVTEVGFDLLALRVKDNTEKLAYVTSDRFIAHLGRPLFATRYEEGDPAVQQALVNFAEAKLTLGKDPLKSPDAALACLAVRFALEFRPKTVEERRIELLQVERHMRMCLSASPGFQYIVTVSASEPLLAEAAANALPHRYVPEILANHLNVWGVNRGDRGELVAMLLVMAARDTAAGDQKQTRIISVLEFLSSLLHESFHSTLFEFKPTVVSQEKYNVSLSDNFENSRLWFNHFIKVEDYDIVNVEFLWRLMVRGAAILCANNQRGFDIIIPILYDNDKSLGSSNMSAIVIQVKNDSSFTYKAQPRLFGGMNPLRTRIFSTPENALPVIRMVFALGATRGPRTGMACGVDFLKGPNPLSRVPKTRTNGSAYTAYDIWCAGVQPDTFGVINKDHIPDYNRILGRVGTTDDAYKVKDDKGGTQKRGDIRRGMHPATQTQREHFQAYIELLPDTKVDDPTQMVFYEKDSEEEEEQKNNVSSGPMVVDA